MAGGFELYRKVFPGEGGLLEGVGGLPVCPIDAQKRESVRGVGWRGGVLINSQRGFHAMRIRNRLLSTAAAAAVLLTTLVGVSATPAQAALPTCTKEAQVKSKTLFDGGRERIWVPVASNGSMNCQMKSGNTGRAVADLQWALWAAGYAIDIDWVFGPATLRSLRDFQDIHQLDVDGIYGPETRSEMCWEFVNIDGCGYVYG